MSHWSEFHSEARSHHSHPDTWLVRSCLMSMLSSLPYPDTTCEISVKMRTVLFYCLLSVSLHKPMARFKSWRPLTCVVTLLSCIYTRSTCSNVHNQKLRWYHLHTYSPCSVKVIEQHCRLFICRRKGKLLKSTFPRFLAGAKHPPLTPVNSPPWEFLLLVDRQRMVLLKACGLSHLSATPLKKKQLAESTTPLQQALTALNITCQCGLILSHWSKWECQQEINNLKLTKCLRKGGREGDPVIETECLEEVINMLSHFYSLQFFSFYNLSRCPCKDTDLLPLGIK